MHVSDPMPLGDKNLAMVDLDVPYLAPASAVSCRGELSEDRLHWADAPHLALRADTAGSFRGSARVAGAWLRFVVEGEGAAEVSVPFDLRVRLSRGESRSEEDA